jgi:ribosomal protein S18 acetylase RimI-like enzyme
MVSVVPREAWRSLLQPLLDERSPADALACYYAFHHPAERKEIFAHDAPTLGRADGFLVRARTGMDLFRPLVTFRADTEAAAQALFETGLLPNRPVYLVAPEKLSAWINAHLLVSEAEIHTVYRFDASRSQTQINVLLTTSAGPDGTPRCEIRSTASKAGAVAGVNWQSPRFAEIFVHTDPAVRGRGWGKSVVAALARQLVAGGRTPLYVVAESNEYSIRLAEAVGFVDTGYREYVGQAVRMANDK